MTQPRKKPGQSWEDHVEQQIREAMERGEFDNLPGKGKPQHIGSTSGDPATEMAHKIVHDAGFAPAWAELEREIEREQKDAEDAVLRSWRWCEAARGDHIENPAWIDAEWRAAREQFARRLTQVNSKILSYNLQLPAPLRHRQRPRLRVETVFARLGISES